MLVDTHCHMNLMIRNFKENEKFFPLTHQNVDACKKIIDDAAHQNVATIINVGTALEESLLCIEIAKHFDNCFATIGLHPNDTKANWPEVMKEFKALLKDMGPMVKPEDYKRCIVGIGECGIDLHYPGYDLKMQQDAFHAQIQLALEHNLALVIHSRDADEQTYQALAQYRHEKNLKGTIHCFSSDANFAQKYIDLGFVLGIGGTVTYPKNEVLRSVVKSVPLEKIIFETDAPFLPPQVIRGQQNSPAHIHTIAQFVAQLRSESFEKVMQTTAVTTQKLFGL